jgi:hypothetical protein
MGPIFRYHIVGCRFNRRRPWHAHDGRVCLPQPCKKVGAQFDEFQMISSSVPVGSDSGGEVVEQIQTIMTELAGVMMLRRRP